MAFSLYKPLNLSLPWNTLEFTQVCVSQIAILKTSNKALLFFTPSMMLIIVQQKANLDRERKKCRMNGNLLSKFLLPGFPGGAVVENPPANAGDTGSSPGLGGSHMPRSN